MTDPTARDLIQRLLNTVKPKYTDPDEIVAVCQALNEARAYLAEPDGPAEPEGSEPASVAYEPSDEEILALAQWHEISYTMLDGVVVYPKRQGCDMRDDVLSFARAVLARWGNR